jgi:NAD-dependent dihydropyrimidine dehydrogenase PreA subunit
MASNAKLSYRQIMMGHFPVGLNGLDETFESLYQASRCSQDGLQAELVHHVRQYNYVPVSAEADFAAALLREYRTYCEQKRSGEAPKRREPWQGMPREQVPWFPSLDEAHCDGCAKCLKFCGNHVYAKRDDGIVYVAEPYNCVVGCDACARLCAHRAITFPPRRTLTLLTCGT